ncbi:hypothetical protein LSTR_LSTR010100 [Laodelphax striatellus]|uniref:Uncharacterized protein n=1 Tax=Laodelphax striatellus TaxID=195883 RepID=A0A482X3N9_LAOST|nr:hypothetical protein LSTR_LSTR010100 [Laodelphax striatellus]
MFGLGALLCAVIVGVTATSDFCWKDTYSRGIGKVPEQCGENQEKISHSCYEKCPPGFKRSGFDCHSICPEHFRDEGHFCRKTEYMRKAYPWKFGDALNDKKEFERCETENPGIECEKCGLIVYTKCAPGFSPFLCGWCRPEKPDCEALGLNPGIDLSCAKKIINCHPKVGVCPSGHELDTGLCYEHCKQDFKGFGPICWSKPPKHWHDCGLGAAKTSDICHSIISNQTHSVSKVLLFFTTGFPACSVDKLKAPADPDQLQKLKEMYNYLKNNKEFQEAASAHDKEHNMNKHYESPENCMKVHSNEEMIRCVTSIASIFDKTGLAEAAFHFTYPKCSKLKINYLPQNCTVFWGNQDLLPLTKPYF